MANFLRSIDLSTRILLVVLALFVAGIWGLAARVAAVLQTDLENVVSAHLSATVGYVAADIDAKFQLRIGVLSEIAASITPDVLADPAKIRRLLEQRNLSGKLFPTGIFVADRTGTMIADHPPLARRVGSSIAQFDYFRAVLAGGKPVIGSPLMGRFSNRATVPLAVPLRDASGAAAGALIGPVYPSDDSLFGLLEETKIGNTSYFLVISFKDGVIVSATDKSQILQPLSAPGVNSLLDRRRQGYEGMGRTVNRSGVDVLSVGRNMRTTGWMVISAISIEEAFAPIASMKQQIYLTALVLSLLAMAVLYVVLRRQLAPLKRVTSAMRRMTEGTAAFAALPGDGKDEIGRLVQSFNRLVAERGRLEDALQLKEQHARALFDAMPIAVGHADTAERITFANRVYRTIYTGGADPVGRSIRDVVGEEIYAVVGPLIKRTLAGEEIQFDRPYSGDDGLPHARWVCYVPDRDAVGEVVGFFALVEDISKRKQTEAALAAKTELLRDTFDNMAEGISIVDRNLRLAGWNRRFAELLGFPESLLHENTTFADIIRFNALRGEYGPGDPEEQVHSRVELAAHFQPHRIERTRPDGTVLEIRGSPLPGSGFVTTYTDITARKNAEAALQRLNAELEQRVAERTQALEQANREMQSFSYSISHDLRAPLRAINGFSKIVLAANAGKFDQETIDNLGRIAAGAERMGLLIDDLLNLSQISRRELRRQAVNLSALAGAVAKHLAQAHPQRRVEVLIAPAIMVEADRGLVQIVLENVIGNAWKFTARTDGARIEVGQLERDGETICFVRDNGAGFDMRYAGKLFGAFQRLHTPREFEGTGIGLSIVQRIVVKHGGRVWAEAKPGQGATLYFTLAPGMSPGMQAI
jgi:PAS domain S-box-containing protein